MFEKGDAVVHPKHGAGVVTGKRAFSVDGNDNQYLCVDLIDESNSKVMVPIDSVQKGELREATGSFDLVREIMFNTPRELDDKHSTRQANIRAQVIKGGLRSVIQGLRDLCWRERSSHLTTTDERLRASLFKQLQRELAVVHEISKQVVKRRVNRIIDEAMLSHAQIVQ